MVLDITRAGNAARHAIDEYNEAVAAAADTAPDSITDEPSANHVRLRQNAELLAEIAQAALARVVLLSNGAVTPLAKEMQRTSLPLIQPYAARGEEGGRSTYDWPSFKLGTFEDARWLANKAALIKWAEHVRTGTPLPRWHAEEITPKDSSRIQGQLPWADKGVLPRALRKYVHLYAVRGASYAVTAAPVDRVPVAYTFTCEMGVPQRGKRQRSPWRLPVWGARIFYPGPVVPLLDKDRRRAFFRENAVLMLPKTFEAKTPVYNRNPKLRVIGHE